MDEGDDFLGFLFEKGPEFNSPARQGKVSLTAASPKSRIRYGITDQEASRLEASQDGGCAICGRPGTPESPLVIDHDHAMGPRRSAVRGMLCNRCNGGLGLFFDDPETLLRAVEYLKNPPAQIILGDSSDA